MGRYEAENLDVICQHCHSGKIIPLRIRVTEDGENHTYTIKEYKQTTVDGAYTTPDGVFVCNGIIIFEYNCKWERYATPYRRKIIYQQV